MTQMLKPLDLIRPGAKGLNLQETGNEDPGFCVLATNCIIDGSGRLAARNGYEVLTGTPLGSTPDIEAIGEHISANGTLTLISAANLNLYSGTTTLTSRTGTITAPTANDWQFINFNNKIIGIQAAHNPIVGTGGAFADVTNASTAGTMPTGNAGLAAFGRVWMVASSTDRTLIRYSDTLDETTWDDDTTPGAAGQLDMKNVIGWGQDTIEALAEFNGHLVVLGKHNIAVYRNPWNPNNNDASTQSYGAFELADIVQGVGCISRDTVKSTGTDLLFMSDQGLMSLGRLLVQQSAPLGEVSKNVHDDLVTNVAAESDTTLKATFHDTERWYIIVLKNSSIMYCFDTKRPLEDGSFRVTKWTGIDPSAIFHSRDDTLYFGHAGVVSNYSGYLDDAATYEYYYKSSWQTLDSDQMKIPKKWELLAEGGAGYDLNLRAFFDYNTTYSEETITVPASTGVAEWGAAEWSIAEWSGSGEFNNLKGWGKGNGRVISLGVNTTINGSDFALQRLLIMLKLGRKP